MIKTDSKHELKNKNGNDSKDAQEKDPTVLATTSAINVTKSLLHMFETKHTTKKVFIVTTIDCRYCDRALQLLDKLEIDYENLMIDDLSSLQEQTELRAVLKRESGQTTFPNIYVGRRHLRGGSDGLFAEWRSGELYRRLKDEGIAFVPWQPPVYGFPKLPHFKPTAKALERFQRGDNARWFLQEKIDGSQFSFRRDETKPDRVIFTNRESKIHEQSKPENAVFGRAPKAIQAIVNKLKIGLTYCAETIEKPRHNRLTYERVPAHFVIVYDIIDEFGRYLWPKDVIRECKAATLEFVPTLYDNTLNSLNDVTTTPAQEIRRILGAIRDRSTTSVLGGIMEGVVLKHPHFATRDGYVALKHKCVTQEFKETRHVRIQPQNVSKVDPSKELERIGRRFHTEARAHKALQHLREAGHQHVDTKHLDADVWNEELDRDLLSEQSMYIGAALMRVFRQSQIQPQQNEKDPFTLIFRKIASEPSEDQLALLLHACLGTILKASRPAVPTP